jgi:hypothetical protein
LWPLEWVDVNKHAFDKPNAALQYAPPPKEPRNEGDPVDNSGHAIMVLLQEAATVAKGNSERAMDLAHKLSIQLRNAEDRIKELEGDIQHYQDRALRAEKWLVRIYQEIEQKFIDMRGR